ncbi:helix-turn-helix domain-containing protein [Streptosporangium sp. NPDC023615]|uniref:helix-turn-helix domain-containing protein n=1 Tax=Streptosporangium sp. NPDC023615 TaxID=3154794 RepID=UPI003434993D
MRSVPSSDGLGFARLLRAHRGRARLTQEELAERARLSVRTLRDLERGRTRYPHRASVRRLAAALELTGEDRLTFEAAPPPRPLMALPLAPAAPPGATVVLPLPGRGRFPERGSSSEPDPFPALGPFPEYGPSRGRGTSREWGLSPEWALPPVSDSVALSRLLPLREAEDAVMIASGGGRPAVVTVTGPAGTGKTTLAVQCAHVLRRRMGMDALFVDLGRDRRDARELRAALRLARLGLAASPASGGRCLLLIDGADGRRDGSAAGRVPPLLTLGFTGIVVTGREPIAGLVPSRRIVLTDPG